MTRCIPAPELIIHIYNPGLTIGSAPFKRPPPFSLDGREQRMITPMIRPLPRLEYGQLFTT